MKNLYDTWLHRIGLGVFFTFVLLISAVPGHAAQKESICTLRPGTYTAYDVTGDKKADKLAINLTGYAGNGAYSGLSIIINGTRAYAIKNSYFYEATVKLCTLKNNKVFIYIFTRGDNDDGPVCGVFRYKNKKLERIINFKTLYRYGSHQNGSVVSVEGNQLTVSGFVMSWAMGSMQYQYTYKYKKGSLVRTSKKGKITGYVQIWSQKDWVTTNRALSLYRTSISARKYKTLKKGTKLKVTHCYVSGSIIRLKVTTKDGQKGWIDSPKKACSNGQGYFEESSYAG